MALQKNIILRSGHEAEYWRILKIEFNYEKPTAVITLGLYKDAAARAGGKLPVIWQIPSEVTRSFELSPEEYETYFGEAVLRELDKTPRSQGYAWLKSLAFFADSEDV